MKKLTKIMCLLITSVFILTACSSKKEEEKKQPEVKEEQVHEENNSVNEKLEGLTLNEYEGIKITAEILPRMAILPGMSVPVTITVTNEGDKKIMYSQGSGSFETPQALVLDVTELQPVLPKDHLGVATMDIRSEELQPGETIQYTLNIMTISANENFNNYTYDKWMADETYIADMEWKDITSEYSDLVLAEPGSYEGNVYFLYNIIEEEQMNPTLSATGYAEGKFTINISE